MSKREKMYHYTTFSTLKGILENEEFWLSHILSMNDTSEVYFHSQSLAHLMNKTMDYKKFKPQHKRRLNSVVKKLNNFKNDIFVMSFSMTEDDASQWERYADGGKGIMLCFNVLDLAINIKDKDENIFLGKVSYGSNENENLKKAVLKLQRYMAYDKEHLDASSENLIETDIVKTIIESSILTKHKSFKSENEKRIFVYSLNQREVSNNVEEVQVKGVPRKVLKLKLDKFTLQNSLDSVVVGPRFEGNISEINELLLKNLVVNHISVRKSECPLR